MKTPEEQTLRQLLGAIRRRFYSGGGPVEQKRWHRERQDLIKALTWPAHWMNERGVSISQPRYRQLLEERLADIAAYGELKRRQAYFPAYLLKCLQDHFAHHGETLYNELKHIRNALYGLNIQVNIQHPGREHEKEIDALARTHRLLTVKAQARRKAPKSSEKQLELF
jgi:hypothetical protein